MVSLLSIDESSAGLDREMKALLEKSVILSFVKPKESCCSMGNVFFEFIKLHDKIHTEDFLAKIPLVEFTTEDHLVKML